MCNYRFPGGVHVRLPEYVRYSRFFPPFTFEDCCRRCVTNLCSPPLRAVVLNDNCRPKSSVRFPESTGCDRESARFGYPRFLRVLVSESISPSEYLNPTLAAECAARDSPATHTRSDSFTVIWNGKWIIMENKKRRPFTGGIRRSCVYFTDAHWTRHVQYDNRSVSAISRGTRGTVRRTLGRSRHVAARARCHDRREVILLPNRRTSRGFDNQATFSIRIITTSIERVHSGRLNICKKNRFWKPNRKLSLCNRKKSIFFYSNKATNR